MAFVSAAIYFEILGKLVGKSKNILHGPDYPEFNSLLKLSKST